MSETDKWSGGYRPPKIKYIQEQETHHAKISFLEKYVDMLKKFGVEYDEQYIFKVLE